MASLFGQTQSPLTDAIDRATSPAAATDDLVIHLEICDMINETETGPRDAAKHLKKKLSPKSQPATIVKAVAVLETAVKNCGKRFHIQVTSKDFCSALAKLVDQKGQSSLVREHVLGLIQTWADAFRSDPTMIAICNLHSELLMRNVEFPAQNLDAMAPIFTPEASVQPQARADHSQASAGQGAAGVAASQPPAGGQALDRSMSQSERDELYARQLAQQFDAEAASSQSPARGRPAPAQSSQGYTMRRQPMQLQPGQRVTVDEEQIDKLRYDLKIVDNNVAMLTDMLGALGPDDRVSDADVIGELHQACNEMRSRVLSLIDSVSNDGLLGDLLAANDALTEAIAKYDAALARHPPQQTSFTSSPPPAAAGGSSAAAGGGGAGNDLLVDFGLDDDDDAADADADAAMAQMNLSAPSQDANPLRQHDGTMRDALRSGAGYAAPEESAGNIGSAFGASPRRPQLPSTSMEEPDEMESTTLGGQSGGFSETTTPQYEGDLIQLDDSTDMPGAVPRATLGARPAAVLSPEHRQRFDEAEDSHFGL